jgi:hypothetical protein
MDEQLAAIYGTGQQFAEEDIEKTAAAELLVKLAEEEGVDLDQFSDDEIAGMIGELYGEGGEGEGEGASIQEGGEGEEKVAEADMLGRVMAHAMVQELGEIEKEAGAKWDAIKGGARWAGHRAGEAPGKAGEALERLGKGVTKHTVGRGVSPERMNPRTAKAIGAATAAAGSAAGYGGYRGGKALFGKGKKKEGSALDKLAEARAIEMLQEAGYEPAEQEKVASQLDFAVEQRALEMLENAGYPVEWGE